MPGKKGPEGQQFGNFPQSFPERKMIPIKRAREEGRKLNDNPLLAPKIQELRRSYKTFRQIGETLELINAETMTKEEIGRVEANIKEATTLLIPNKNERNRITRRVRIEQAREHLATDSSHDRSAETLGHTRWKSAELDRLLDHAEDTSLRRKGSTGQHDVDAIARALNEQFNLARPAREKQAVQKMLRHLLRNQITLIGTIRNHITPTMFEIVLPEEENRQGSFGRGMKNIPGSLYVSARHPVHANALKAMKKERDELTAKGGLSDKRSLPVDTRVVITGGLNARGNRLDLRSIYSPWSPPKMPSATPVLENKPVVTANISLVSPQSKRALLTEQKRREGSRTGGRPIVFEGGPTMEQLMQHPGVLAFLEKLTRGEEDESAPAQHYRLRDIDILARMQDTSISNSTIAKKYNTSPDIIARRLKILYKTMKDIYEEKKPQ